MRRALASRKILDHSGHQVVRWHGEPHSPAVMGILAKRIRKSRVSEESCRGASAWGRMRGRAPPGEETAKPRVLASGREQGNGERGIRTLDTGLPVYTLSRRAPSTTRPSLLLPCGADCTGGGGRLQPLLVTGPVVTTEGTTRRSRCWWLRSATASCTGNRLMAGGLYSARGDPYLLPIVWAPLAQLDRAADYGSAGREFESLRAHFFADRPVAG